MILGVDAEKRKILASTTPIIEITFDGTIFREVVQTQSKNYTMECHLGKEFVHDAIELGGSMSVSNMDSFTYRILTRWKKRSHQ